MNRITSLISLYTIVCFATASFAGKDDPVVPPPNRNIIIIEDGLDEFDLYALRADAAPAAPAPLIFMPNPPLPFNDAALATRIPRVEFPPLDDHARVMIACVFLVAAMKARAQ